MNRQVFLWYNMVLLRIFIPKWIKLFITLDKLFILEHLCRCMTYMIYMTWESYYMIHIQFFLQARNIYVCQNESFAIGQLAIGPLASFSCCKTLIWLIWYNKFCELFEKISLSCMQFYKRETEDIASPIEILHGRYTFSQDLFYMTRKSKEFIIENIERNFTPRKSSWFDVRTFKIYFLLWHKKSGLFRYDWLIKIIKRKNSLQENSILLR